MLFLKQSTASQIRLLGPFVDKTDGVTAETGLTIANTDIRLSANGGNMFAKTSGGGTHDEIGYYAVTFDATDTATVGSLQVAVSQVANALAVYHEFWVLEEAIYDALFAASANAFNGAAGSSAVGLVDLVTTTTTNTDMVGTDSAALASVLGAAAGASISADIAAVKTETAAILDDTDLIDDGTSGLAKIATDVAATLVDTAVIGALGAGLTALATQVSVDAVQTTVDAIETDTGAIETDTADIQSRLPAALASGNMKSDVLAIDGSTGAADYLQKLMDSGVSSTVNDAGGTTTVFITNLSEATNDHYKGRLVTFTDGVLAGQQTDITGYNGTTKAITCTAVTENVPNTTAFVIH